MAAAGGGESAHPDRPAATDDTPTDPGPPRRGPFADFAPAVRRQLPLLVAFRFVSNTAIRYPYSFLPAIARGAGMGVESLGWLLFARELTGAGAPIAGRLADGRGPDRLVAAGALIGAASLVAGVAGQVGLAVGLIGFGLAKVIYDVAMNAWIGDHVAYARRGRAMGLVEVTWAAAALIGLPLIGLTIDRLGWWSASAALAVVAVPLAAAITAVHGKPTSTRPTTAATRRPHVDVGLVGTLAAFCAITSASQFLIIGHGLWLDDVYGLDPAEIGAAVMIVGAIEAVGSSSSSRFTDSWGKRTSVAGGTALMTMAMAALAALPEPPLAVALAMLATAFLGFEFALVSALPLLSEIDPGARAQVMGWALGSSTVLRAVGSVVGASLFGTTGFGG